jgi:Gpi18-like mannosyltransferase
VFTKLPAIFFDVAAALAVYAACRMFTTEKRARLWGLAMLLHPAAIYLSSLWGQTDAVYSALLFASIACLVGRKPGFAGALFAASMLHKPNALLFVPVIGLLTLRDLKTFVRFAMTWALVMVATHLYFLVSGSEWTYLTLLSSSSDRANNGFGNALNFWRTVFGEGMWGRPARDACIGAVSCYAIAWGTVCVLSLPFLWITWSLRKAASDRASVIFGAASSVSAATYIFATGMHERYLFPYILLAIPFAQRGWLQATVYWSISTLYLVSIMDHWRPVPWFDPVWSALLADTSARLLVVFGLLHMGLVIRDAWNERKAPAKPAPKKPTKKKVTR